MEVFEGNKGLMDTITGPFELDWSSENLEAVRLTSVKRYNAEFHSQSVLEGIVELRELHSIQPEEIEHITIDIFDVAYHIIGGGEEGEKKEVRTKEEADHSLPYMVAAALLDGDVTPAQYAQERIMRDDVQRLLRTVVIQPDETLSEQFPAQMPCRIHIQLKSGQILSCEKHDFTGFYTRPLSWEQACAKFERLTAPFMQREQYEALTDTVAHLETKPVQQLTELLGVPFQETR